MPEEDVQFDGAWELTILTSKNVDFLLLYPKFWALMLSLVPSSVTVLVLLRGKLSLLSGFGVGSTPTIRHTSVRSCAVMSLTTLCQKTWHALVSSTHG